MEQEVQQLRDEVARLQRALDSRSVTADKLEVHTHTLGRASNTRVELIDEGHLFEDLISYLSFDTYRCFTWVVDRVRACE